MASGFVLVCDGQWSSFADGTTKCSGVLSSVPADELASARLTPEEAAELKNGTIVLFCIVFAFLALKKAL